MSTTERYFQVITDLMEGRLLVLRERLAHGRGLFEIFAGFNPEAGDRMELPCSPTDRPGEVFFSLGESGRISLHPFVVTDAESGPLWFYNTAERILSEPGATTAWVGRYRSVGGERAECKRGIGPGPNFESACRAARAT